MMRQIMFVAAAATFAPGAAAQEIANDQATRSVNHLWLRGLDTLSGTTRDLEMTVGDTIRYGNLEVTAEACRVPEADPEGDAYAFLRIRDIRDEQPRFSGWMFASSPALSALDHPRYDVWVLRCSNL